MKIKNFGGNIVFSPKYFYLPSSEEEVLGILNRHKNDNIRTMGSLHAWSDAVSSDGVLINLAKIDQISVEKNNSGDSLATVGGGCVLSKLSGHLNNMGLTMPALGAIQRQTIAGAVSTGTHGSGNSSISDHIKEIRIAAYEPIRGNAEIYQFKEGDTLRAARCSIGCLGVILSVKFECPKEYWIEEKTTVFKNISDVLNGEKEYPLQQFGLMPFSWYFVAYQRKIADKVPEGFNALKMSFLKLADYIGTEIITHFVIKILANFSKEGVRGRYIKWFYQDFIGSFVNQKRIVLNKSIRALTLHMSHHDTFKHLEMEVFIPIDRIKKGVDIIRWTASYFAGSSELPEEIMSEIKKIGMFDRLIAYQGSYTHHYPFFFRRIFPDDTLISMTSGKQIYYSVSFFTYLAPDKRKGFYNYADFMAELLMKLFDARLHWGKYFPLANKDIEHLYPELPAFRQICRSMDTKGVFQNDFTKKVLGFRNV